MKYAIFVDLPNFYGGLIRAGLEDPKETRHYFLTWFNFEELSKKLTASEYVDIWVFYSSHRLGPSDARIEKTDLHNLVQRFNTVAGVTARDVNIPGKQRETLDIACPKCGFNNPNVAWNSEKGIDSSLIVHLFDTMDVWDVAYLLSGDADFVPAVASLRRRGKIVIGAGFPNRASPALIRECYQYVDLARLFFGTDLGLYNLCKPGGVIETWFTKVTPAPNAVHGEQTLYLIWGRLQGGEYRLTLSTSLNGGWDLSQWEADLRNLRNLPPGEVRSFSRSSSPEVGKSYTFFVPNLFGDKVERRVYAIMSEIGAQEEERKEGKKGDFRVSFRYPLKEGE